MAAVIKLYFSAVETSSPGTCLEQDHKCEQKNWFAAQVVYASIHEVQHSWIFFFTIIWLFINIDYEVRIIWGIFFVNVSVHPCLPLAESSHKISQALFQQHFIAY